MNVPIEIHVNGRTHSLDVPANTTLLELLRDHLDVRSVHRGCDEGECGACTVLLNGEPVYSCLTLAVQAHQAHILTVEGLSRDGEMHPLVRSFLDHHGVQCGYCTPGMILTAYSLLSRQNDLTEDEIRKGIEGNLCRCTGYVNIVKAIQSAAEAKDKGSWW
jgi:carbon-monoxide dehydrogenase small subunit